MFVYMLVFICFSLYIETLSYVYGFRGCPRVFQGVSEETLRHEPKATALIPMFRRSLPKEAWAPQ